MNVETSNERDAVRYLLGEMTEPEQARLEEMFFRDAELSEFLSEVEDDLIDQYVRGELSRRQSEQFEQHFLVSQRRREKLDCARILYQAERAAIPSLFSETSQSVPSELASDATKVTWWQTILGRGTTLSPAFSYAIAVVAPLLLVGGIWLVYEIVQRRNEVARLTADRATKEMESADLRNQITAERRRNDDLAAQREQLEQELARLRQRSEEGSHAPSTPTTLVAFLLAPSYRGSQGPQRLTLPRHASSVRLQLSLNQGDGYSRYRINLQTASGAPIRTWSGVRAGTLKGERVISVDLPAAQLRASQYELTLSGASASGRLEDLGYYYFTLAKD